MSPDINIIEFINDAFKHCKFIAAEDEGNTVLGATNAMQSGKPADEGVLSFEKENNQSAGKTFIKALGSHRYWDREEKI